MKGEITLKILEVIGDTVVNAADVFSAISNSGYGASHGKMQREISKRQAERSSKAVENRIKAENKQKYYNLVFYLKKHGLIKEKSGLNKKFLFLTQKGKDKLCFLKQKNENRLPEVSYEKETDNKFTIIVFDIPEKERRKRDWLRLVLSNLGFSMIQKSVWMGKVKIPKNFIDDLLRLKLIDCVEIFEISKAGSLEKVI